MDHISSPSFEVDLEKSQTYVFLESHFDGFLGVCEFSAEEILEKEATIHLDREQERTHSLNLYIYFVDSSETKLHKKRTMQKYFF